MSKLKGYRKINKFLTDGCQENGFNVKCRLGTEFEFNSEDNIIYYALVVPDTKNEHLFENLCSSYLKDIINCDLFILAFFHELGHYMTADNFTDEEGDAYYLFTENLYKKKKLTKRDYNKYYNHFIELTATKWGCDYINSHINKIIKFSKSLGELVTEFYIKNNVEF